MARALLAAALLLVASPARGEDRAVPPSPWIPSFFVRGGFGFPDLLGGSASIAIRWAEVEGGLAASPWHRARLVRAGPRFVLVERDMDLHVAPGHVELSSSLLGGVRFAHYEFVDRVSPTAVVSLQARLAFPRRYGVGFEVASGVFHEQGMTGVEARFALGVIF